MSKPAPTKNTTKNNTENKDGYLEEYFIKNKKITVKDYILSCYGEFFIVGKSSLSKASLMDMEDATMQNVRQYIEQNHAVLSRKQPLRRVVREEMYGSI